MKLSRLVDKSCYTQT